MTNRQRDDWDICINLCPIWGNIKTNKCNNREVLFVFSEVEMNSKRPRSFIKTLCVVVRLHKKEVKHAEVQESWFILWGLCCCWPCAALICASSSGSNNKQTKRAGFSGLRRGRAAFDLNPLRRRSLGGVRPGGGDQVNRPQAAWTFTKGTSKRLNPQEGMKGPSNEQRPAGHLLVQSSHEKLSRPASFSTEVTCCLDRGDGRAFIMTWDTD
ncbi:Hypothetical predicted protein [Xyrichtys novacula]|uniref:Uncharacterized protein n=1 Tax=Xyrichtys novacula TaxID=13765 RepID=A0AAV1H2R5_XYRNO|nr:Hypothetical predicted protein [Xyrichtys novacula]